MKMGIWGLTSGREKGYKTEEKGCCNSDQSQGTGGHQSFFSQLPLLLEKSDFFHKEASLVAQMVKNLPAMCKTWV